MRNIQKPAVLPELAYAEGCKLHIIVLFPSLLPWMPHWKRLLCWHTGSRSNTLLLDDLALVIADDCQISHHHIQIDTKTRAKVSISWQEGEILELQEVVVEAAAEDTKTENQV